MANGPALLKEKDKPKKERKLKVSTIKNKCDGLLTPIIKQIFPRCLLCNNPTQVAHHHVHKSKSTRLRYELSNLINLCHKCHLALHHNESYYASRIVKIKGLAWFEDLEKMKQETVKADVTFYLNHFTRLTKIYEGTN